MMTIHPAKKAEIALWLAKKVTLPNKYLDFTNVFSKMSTNILLECTGVNEHTLELEKSKQPLY